MVHFHKSFGVMQELCDHRDFTTFMEDLRACAIRAAPPGALPVPAFLDLGCAPGGFSASLLQDHMLGPTSVGFGVSLPAELGGFPMAFASERLCVQLMDILGLEPSDLMCHDNSVDLCCADAQNLSNFFKQRSTNFKYGGLQVRSRTLGIWALTVKECLLSFAKLRAGGAFVFRFGWRGMGDADVHPTGEQVHPALLAKYLEEEEWYKALTHWLFSVLKSLFSTLKPFKSEYVHQADVSFYMVCRGFDREKYEKNEWEAKLYRAFVELSTSEDEAALVEDIKTGINEEVKAEINDILDYVGRMRAIGIESRKITASKLAEKNGTATSTTPQERPSRDSRAETTPVERDSEEKADHRSASSSSRPREAEKAAAEDANSASGVAQPSSSSAGANDGRGDRSAQRGEWKPRWEPRERRTGRHREENAHWLPRDHDPYRRPNAGAMQGTVYSHPAFLQNAGHYGGGMAAHGIDQIGAAAYAYQDHMMGHSGMPLGAAEQQYCAGAETYVAAENYGALEHMHSDPLLGGGLRTAGTTEPFEAIEHMHSDPLLGSGAYPIGYAHVGLQPEGALNPSCGAEAAFSSATTSAPSPQEPSLASSASSAVASEVRRRATAEAPVAAAEVAASPSSSSTPAAKASESKGAGGTTKSGSADVRQGGNESDSFSSDDEGYDHRRLHRHKRRAGRIVRERRMGRRRRNGALISESQPRRGRDLSSKLKASVAALADEGNLILPALRFGLFCAMACSLNSIVYSMFQMYRGQPV